MLELDDIKKELGEEFHPTLFYSIENDEMWFKIYTKNKKRFAYQNWPDVEPLKMNIKDFRERIINPMVSSLEAYVQEQNAHT